MPNQATKEEEKPFQKKIQNKISMRILGLLLFTIVLFSCQKKKDDDGQHCYTCHLTGGIPYEHRTVDTCSGDVTSDKYHFQDANGNTMDFLCVEK